MTPRDRIRASFGKPEATLESALSIPEQRAAWERWAADGSVVPEGVSATAADSPVPATLIVPAGAERGPLIIHLHGGGFVTGSAKTHLGLGIRMALASRARVLLVDYRRAPEHVFPAARDDALAVWMWAIEQGNEPARIVLSGDSAGAHVALTAFLMGQQREVPAPAALVLISPWLDLAQRGESMQSRAAVDPQILQRDLADCARLYLGGISPLALEVNPLDGPLKGLPPVLVQVGDEEILLSDSTRFAERARAAGARVELQVWPKLWHVFHFHAPELPEANEAIEKLGAFAGSAIR
jgi:epsilon-lactone hydrolase